MSLLVYEDSDHRRERDHADIASYDAEHRNEDEYPESYSPYVSPGRLGEYEEHREGDRVEKK